ncbi:MAG: RNHCP domain-containing protein [Rickettsiales bacterium]|nr:RNHCP domain-containing protein [Rickettsiales bacterium]
MIRTPSMKKFSRRAENFICENCGFEVTGNGYTNHCPKCFYSKHADINPGDRNCKCMGLMEPIAVSQKKGKFFLEHRCKKCGFIRKNAVSEEDDREELIKLMKSFQKQIPQRR